MKTITISFLATAIVAQDVQVSDDVDPHKFARELSDSYLITSVDGDNVIFDENSEIVGKIVGQQIKYQGLNGFEFDK